MAPNVLRDFTIRKAILCRQLGNFDMAITLFSQLLDNPPWNLTHDDIMMQLALTNFRSGKITIAYNQFKNLYESHPTNKMCIRQFSIITFLTTDERDLTKILPTILKNQEQCPDYHTQLVIARIYYLISKYPESYEYFKSSLEYWSNHPPFWIAFGSLYFKNEQLDDAAVAFQRAIYMNQTSTTAWLNLGFIFERKGQQEKAKSIYLAGQKQCKREEFAAIIKKKSELMEVDNEELLPQVPEAAAKEYIRVIPYIDSNSVGLPGVSLDDIKVLPQTNFSE
jgi:tetratricopeptide (TPR) repeat protein